MAFESRSSSRKKVLNDIYAETISMDDVVTSKAKSIVKSFVEDIFIDEMKETDKTFKAFFQRIFYAGSFYDGLRVGEATEFDLNVVFDLPFYGGDFELVTATEKDAQFFDVVPGSAIMCTKKNFTQLMPKNHPRYSDYKFLENFFECVHYSGIVFRDYKYVLLPNKLLAWFESIVTRAKNNIVKKKTSQLGRWWYGEKFKYSKYSEAIKIDLSKSGPAFTLSIASDSGLKIDVDLVAVIEYRYADTVLVPKPYSNGSQRLWRLSYPLRERAIFHDQSCAKKVVKLLKGFRDKQGSPWKRLSSYYLKTLVMLVLKEDQNCLESQMDEVFIRCLEQLLQCLTEGKIPFFHDSNCNLLQNLKPETIENMKGRLERIVCDIRKNPPETMRKYFVVEECCPETVDGSEPTNSSCLIM